MANENWQNRSGSKRQHGRGNNRDRRGGGGMGGGMPGNRNQTLDSNGPMGRIRGNAYQICERYLSQARDAASSGDRIMAENLYQHAEHYLRMNNMFNETREENRKFRNEQVPDAAEVGGEENGGAVAMQESEAALPPGMEEQPSILDAPLPGAPDLFAKEGEPVAEAAPKPKRGHWRRKPKEAGPVSEGEAGAAPDPAPGAAD